MSGLKQAIAQAVIDRILERTDDGEGVSFSGDGQARSVKLKSPYSKMYQESLEFKAAGKSKGQVNMSLTGDMLSSVDVLSISGNKIKIGISDENEKLKAFNHLTGDTVPRRPWFGVSQKELRAIAEDFSGEIEQAKTRKQTPVEEKALDILKRLNQGEEDV